MIDFCPEDSEVIFDSCFLLLDLLFNIVDVFLLVSEKKDQFIRKNIRLVDESA
jgi:hypothetical protein